MSLIFFSRLHSLKTTRANKARVREWISSENSNIKVQSQKMERFMSISYFHVEITLRFDLWHYLEEYFNVFVCICFLFCFIHQRKKKKAIQSMAQKNGIHCWRRHYISNLFFRLVFSSYMLKSLSLIHQILSFKWKIRFHLSVQMFWCSLSNSTKMYCLFVLLF